MRRASTKRIVSALGKLNWGKRAYAVFVLCAMTTIALPAQTFTTLYRFDYTDGADPEAALVQATDGDFYGTTAYGGAKGDGTVFKVTSSGTLTTLYSLCSQSGCIDGTVLTRGWSRPPTGTPTRQPRVAGPTALALARSSELLRVAR